MKRAAVSRTLVLLSDSTGDLGERFLRALISQFPKDSFVFRVFSFIQAPDDLERIMRAIAGDQPILFHTTLHSRLKSAIERAASRRGWPCYDLTGGAMAYLEKASGRRARPTPEELHALNQEYEERIRSLEFTVSHDDGMNPGTLRQADIILIGVSRTSKTPTSIYLAYKGYKVANVPLIKGIAPPEQLTSGGVRRVAGLIIDPEKLMAIRQRRAQEERIPGALYTDLEAIRAELDWAHSLMLEFGCPIVDVTTHAVEETAALVLKTLHLR